MANMRYIQLNADKTPKTNYDTFRLSTEKFENAGYLLPNDVIVVDFDEHKEVAEKIISAIKTRVVVTKRGYHLYFKVPQDLKPKNVNKVITTLGVPVDYKTGYGGKKQYAIVKLNGVDRDVINKEIKEFPYLPKILYPTKSKIDLASVEEGNRNEDIFKHFLNVVESYPSWSIEELEQLGSNILNIMNNPIDDKEMDNIISSCIKRKNVNSSTFFVEKKGKMVLDIFKLTEYLKSKLNCVYYSHQLYFSINGRYTSDSVKLMTYLLDDLNLKLMKKDDSEIYHQLKKVNKYCDNSNLPIVFKNNLMLHNNKIQDYDGSFSPFMLDVNYDSDAYDENVDKFLRWCACGNKEIVQLFKCILGHTLMSHGFPQVAFFLVSEKGSNGKSTFIEMINDFYGSLSSNLALQELKDKTDVEPLVGKLVNCGDDISDSFVQDSRLFKSLVAGNSVAVRRLYEQSYTHRNTATMIFTLNKMPEFKDKTGGVKRRFVMIPFTNYIDPENADLNLREKLSTDNAKSYILNLALEGLNYIIKNNGIIIPQKCKDLVEEYMINSNNVLKFHRFYTEEMMKDIDGSLTSVVYMDYISFCDEELNKPCSKTKFTQELSKLGYISTTTKIKGKSVRIYVKEKKK